MNLSKRVALRATKALLLFGVGFSLLIASGCKDKKKVPKEDSTRVKQLVGKLPSETQAAVVVSDYTKARRELQTLKKRIGDVLPFPSEIKEGVEGKISVNPFEIGGWKSAGFHPKGGLALGVVNEQPILVAYLKDKKKFEKKFIEARKIETGVSGNAKSKTVNGHTVKYLGKKRKEQSAWAYKDNIVIAAFPPLPSGMKRYNAKGGFDKATKAVGEVLDTKTSNSLYRHKSFQRYQEALGKEYVLTTFMNNRAYMTEARMKRIKQQENRAALRFIKWIKNNVNGVAFGLKSGKDVVHAKMWLGLRPDLASKLSELVTIEGTVPWEKFGASSMLGGLRISIDWQQFMPLLKEKFPSYWQGAKGQLVSLKAKTGVDVEKQIFGQMTGNISLLLYDLKLSALTGGLAQLLTSTKFLIATEFQKGSDLKGFLEKYAKNAEGNYKVGQLSTGDGKTYEDIHFIQKKNILNVQPFRLYVRDTMAIIATNAFQKKELAQFLTEGIPDKKRLSANESLELGQQFLGADGTSGLYLNIGPIGKLAKDRLPPFQSVVNFFDRVRELLLSVELTEKGAYLHLQTGVKSKGQ